MAKLTLPLLLLALAVSVYGGGPSLVVPPCSQASMSARTSSEPEPVATILVGLKTEQRPDYFKLITKEWSRAQNWKLDNPRGRRMGECCDTYGCVTCDPSNCLCTCNLENYECQCLCSLLPPGQQAQCLQQCYLEETCCYANRCNFGSCGP
jgi:hypothetical protein